jgi:signal transduction histidine kinase
VSPKNHRPDEPIARSGARPEGWPGFSRYGSVVLLVLIFCTVSAVGLFVIRDLRNADVEARKMYAGSVLGLHRIGDLQYETQETRRSTFYALSTADSNLQVKYADNSREADRRVSEGISAYLANARTPSEVETGKQLQRDWAAYLKVRDEVLASILEGSTQEAVDLDLTDGVQSFDRIRRDVAEIERLYDEQAFQQLANVDASSRRTIIRVAGVLAITLIAAIASVWTIQRIRLAGAIQLAKLQMEFVASVSHELRTPLAVISSAADNIADGLVHGKEDLKRYGGVIQNQSRQTTELVNQILQFAATQERKDRYVLRPLEVSEIIRVVVEGTKEVIHNQGFTLEQQVEPGLPCVLGDLSALAQCLQNLVLNAVKYSGESRWIRISAAWNEPADESRKEICITVEDRGIGIDRSELYRIFDPFYRSPAVSSAQIHGTGLGLSLARNLAESMGGRLSVVSQLGVGSVFTLHLPTPGERKLKPAADRLRSDALIQK